MSKRRASMVATAATALAIAGCGGSGPSTSPSATGSASATAAGAPTTPASSASSSGTTTTTPAATADPVGFTSGFARDRRRLHMLGLQLSSQLRRAPRESDLALSVRFRSLSARLLALSSDMASLRPPPRYRGDVAHLAASLGAVGQDVGQISRAATRHDAPLARQATVRLVTHSLQVRAFETRLSHRLGLRAP